MSDSAYGPRIAWWERASDRLNPILVKETRQALKSRQFLATFFLMLLSAWAISVFGVSLGGGPAALRYQSHGPAFFTAYYWTLGAAIYMVVPFAAFRSVLSERDLHTFEVLSITTLQPRQVVTGKLASALLQMFIYYSAITPFMAFTTLLRGLDVPSMAFVLAWSLLGSLGLSMLALTVSACGRQRATQAFTVLAVLIGLISAFSMLGFLATGMIVSGHVLEFSDPEFWVAVAVLLTYYAAYFCLCMRVAVAQLTFDADDRSSSIRLTVGLIFWLTMAWLLIAHAFYPTSGATHHRDFLLFAFTALSLHFAILGLIASTELDVLSRRLRRQVAESRWRRLTLVLLPGGSRGLVYTFAHIALIILAAGYAVMMGYDERILTYVLLLNLYIVIYVGFGAAFGRWAGALSSEFRPVHARVLTVLAFAFLTVLPFFGYMFDLRLLESIWWITNPVVVLVALWDGRLDYIPLITLILGALAAVAVVINLRTMIRGLWDILKLHEPQKPKTPPELAQPLHASTLDFSPPGTGENAAHSEARTDQARDPLPSVELSAVPSGNPAATSHPE